MRLTAGGAVSGWAALRLWGGGFFDGTRDGRTDLAVDLVVLPEADIRRAPGIVRHRSALAPAEVRVRYGIPCTVPHRALFDALRWARAPLRRQQIADLALSARLTTKAEMDAYLTSPQTRRGRRLVEHTLAQASDRVLSPQETTLRMMWEQRAGLPPLLPNWPVADRRGRTIGRPDLLCEQEAVVIEYDGRDHTRDDVRVVDMTKEDAYRRCGLEYIRVIDRDLAHPDRILTRMREAVLRSRSSGRPRTFRLARNPPPVLQLLGR